MLHLNGNNHRVAKNALQQVTATRSEQWKNQNGATEPTEGFMGSQQWRAGGRPCHTAFVTLLLNNGRAL